MFLGYQAPDDDSPVGIVAVFYLHGDVVHPLCRVDRKIVHGMQGADFDLFFAPLFLKIKSDGASLFQDKGDLDRFGADSDPSDFFWFGEGKL
jgi:hypothetical protein